MLTNEQFEATSAPATMIRIRNVWRIDEFTQMKESSNNETFITSKLFGSDLWPECIWQLRLYPSYSDFECCGTDDHYRWDLFQVGTPEISAKFKVCAYRPMLLL